MVAYLCFILVILCFIGYFVFSLIQLIPLAIILIIDSLIFIVVKKLFKKGGLAILGALLLIATALVPTGYFGYKSLNGFKQVWVGKDELAFELEDLENGRISYKISMYQFAKKPYLTIKEYYYDKNDVLKADEKYFYEEGNIGQYVQGNSNYIRPCYFEYVLSNENGKHNGKILRIGLKDENGKIINPKHVIKHSGTSLPGGVIEDMVKSENAYILFLEN